MKNTDEGRYYDPAGFSHHSTQILSRSPGGIITTPLTRRHPVQFFTVLQAGLRAEFLVRIHRISPAAISPTCQGMQLLTSVPSPPPPPPPPPHRHRLTASPPHSSHHTARRNIAEQPAEHSGGSETSRTGLATPDREVWRPVPSLAPGRRGSSGESSQNVVGDGANRVGARGLN